MYLLGNSAMHGDKTRVDFISHSSFIQKPTLLYGAGVIEKGY